ncbi:ABC transporter permease [Mycetocola reblochoni]|uniref:Dipeptide transport system permease protein DppC (TC 3.A.1.5.2) n=2 Tax=Mycetocola reblochoni TaxID=331618 RepID=A0A1R4JSV0_9MICO|nr:ABC transporter permease [Mycetocola reblochoni]RLP70413.1 ABC transporter permease [Mycetocola reblochoni]SJN35160.1 Dipeptide transport system permease protein DppC (TC 3.A.1.5.2) [Mycetocola reblochoni REB411]
MSAPRLGRARHPPLPRTASRRPGRAARLGVLGWTGAALVTVVLLVALVSLLWTPYPPQAADPYARWAAPGGSHLLGTDASGRDVLSLLMAGARTALLVAVLGGALAGLTGVLLGAVGALTPHRVRTATAVLIDVLLAFPTVLLAMLLASVLGGSLGVVIGAVGLGFGVTIARVLRGEFRTAAASDYVLAARAAGMGPVRILRDHQLPAVSGVLIVQLSWTMALAVLAEAGLSYLGYGAGPEVASWGRMLADMQSYLAVYPLTVLWPGLAVTLTGLGFTLLGDGLRDAGGRR